MIAFYKYAARCFLKTEKVVDNLRGFRPAINVVTKKNKFIFLLKIDLREKLF